MKPGRIDLADYSYSEFVVAIESPPRKSRGSQPNPKRATVKLSEFGR
jgi:hypothetical protein